MSSPEKRDAPEQPTGSKARRQVGIRLEPEFIARFNAVREHLKTPWYRPTLSDAVRYLLIDGLEHLESCAEEHRNQGKGQPR